MKTALRESADKELLSEVCFIGNNMLLYHIQEQYIWSLFGLGGLFSIIFLPPKGWTQTFGWYGKNAAISYLIYTKQRLVW